MNERKKDGKLPFIKELLKDNLDDLGNKFLTDKLLTIEEKEIVKMLIEISEKEPEIKSELVQKYLYHIDVVSKLEDYFIFIISQDLTIRYTNNRVEKYFNLKLSNLIGCSLEDLIEDCSSISEVLNADDKEGGYNMELVINGRTCFVNLQVKAIDSGGENTEYMLMFNDKKYVRRNNYLELTRLAHDTQTATHSIRRLLNELGRSLDCVEQNVQMANIKSLVNGISIRNTEALNSCSNDTSSVVRKMVSFHSVLGTVMESVKYYDGFDEIEIYSSIQESLKFYGDESTLNSILLILFVNSIEYRRRDGEQAYIQVKINHHGLNKDQICIETKDNGLGMTNEEIESADVDSDNDTTSAGKSNSLKLASQYVHELGGTMKIKSKVGKGTSVKLILDIVYNPQIFLSI